MSDQAGASQSGGPFDWTDPAAVRQWFDSYPLHRALGFRWLEGRAGWARFAIPASAVTAGGVAGSIHGGVLAAAVDIALVAAVVPLIGPGEAPAGTADLKITYLRPALGDDITVEATVLKKGRQIAVAEVSVLDAAGKLCARGRALYAIRPLVAPPG